jgi:3-oxoacyl-[acyl-carrier-protein] synthase II
MIKNRIVITGIGIIASNGIGKTAFSEAIFKGASGIKPVSLFDASLFETKQAGEISDFKPHDFLGEKGLRTLDRSTKLLASTVKLALDNAKINIAPDNTKEIGIAIGTTLGSVHSICEFDKEAIKEGARYVNPALFPNTVINSAASQSAIKFNIQGFNTTISTGFTAGLDAINYATKFIKLGRAKIVLAGGVEELCPETFAAFYKTKFMAGLKKQPALSCPFDKRRNGIIFGEGSAILVLEDLSHALSRNASIYGEISGYGTAYEAFRIYKYSRNASGLKQAMASALLESKIKEKEISYVSSGANSTMEGDILETNAMKSVFGNFANNVPVTSIKSMLGETFSASGALQSVEAVCAIEKQSIPPTINYQEKDEECDLDYVINKPRNSEIKNVLINSFGPSGCNSSLIISQFKG